MTALERYAEYAHYKWQPNLVAELLASPFKRSEQFRSCHARLEYRGPYVILVSYNTPVAMAYACGTLHSINPQWYSNTTTRQTRWFLQDICAIKNP